MDINGIVSGIAIGLAAGALGGIFGIGGGLVMVPAMVGFLHFTQQKSQGTSLAVLMVPVALPAVINYYRSGFVDLKIAAIIALGFLVGGFFGSRFAVGLSDATLKKSFAIFLVCVAAYMWFKADQKAPPIEDPHAPTAAQTQGT